MADLDLSGLDQVIEELGGLQEMGPKVLERTCEAVIETCSRNIAAQVGPDGKAWPPARDGRTPLKNARKALSYQVAGNTGVVSLTGIEARHHFGAIKGGAKGREKYARPILPGPQDNKAVVRAFGEGVSAALPSMFRRSAG